jgi:hypothetical protein
MGMVEGWIQLFGIAWFSFSCLLAWYEESWAYVLERMEASSFFSGTKPVFEATSQTAAKETSLLIVISHLLCSM